MLGRLFRSRVTVGIVCAALGASIAGGIALAAIPQSVTTQITTCYPKTGATKTLRVIDYQAGQRCTASENTLSWQANGLHWRGAWSATTPYAKHDVVTNDGSSYVAVLGGANHVPPNATYWAVLATKSPDIARCSGYPHPGIDWSLPGSTPGHGCDFHGAIFEGVDLEGADLRNANLVGTRFLRIEFQSGTRQVNLADSNLSNADLTGATLFNALLPGANLTGAKLTSADLGTAHLPAADLSGVDLSGATLSGANLTGATLSGANLTGAVLYNTILTGSDLTDVLWSHTQCPDHSYSDTNGTAPESCIGHLSF